MLCSLDDRQALHVDVGGDQRSSECVDVDAVEGGSVGAGVHGRQLLLRACVHVGFDGVGHGVGPCGLLVLIV